VGIPGGIVLLLIDVWLFGSGEGSERRRVDDGDFAWFDGGGCTHVGSGCGRHLDDCFATTSRRCRGELKRKDGGFLVN